MKTLFLGRTGIRLMKTLLVALIALFALLVAFNNIFDYNSNFMFVQHVLSMDTTFEGNALMWRALTDPWIHHFAYLVIILFEALVGLICAYASFRMFILRNAADADFAEVKVLASWGLVLGVLLWFGGFMAVGAEWFLMWQSPIWNGQEAAFRFIMSLLGTLIFLHQDDSLCGTVAADNS